MNVLGCPAISITLVAMMTAAIFNAGCSPAPGTEPGAMGGSGGSEPAGGGGGGGSGGMAGTGGSGGKISAGSSGGMAGAGGSGGTTGGAGGSNGGSPQPLYLVSIDHVASPSRLLKIDVQTGIGKTVCTLPQIFDAINYVSSTFSRNGTLFASNHQDTRIDQIDPCTCEVTPIGSTGFGSIPGITANKAQGLFGIETTLDILLDINPMTGQAMKLGDLGVDFSTGGATWSDALNGGQGGLYALSGATNSLHSINPMTGLATTITPIVGVTFGSVGIEMHPANGVIYACTNDPLSLLYAIHPGTGITTAIGTGMGHVGECNNLAAPWTPVACLDTF